jgi:hypothetical protein
MQTLYTLNPNFFGRTSDLSVSTVKIQTAIWEFPHQGKGIVPGQAQVGQVKKSLH